MSQLRIIAGTYELAAVVAVGAAAAADDGDVDVKPHLVRRLSCGHKQQQQTNRPADKLMRNIRQEIRRTKSSPSCRLVFGAKGDCKGQSHSCLSVRLIHIDSNNNNRDDNNNHKVIELACLTHEQRRLFVRRPWTTLLSMGRRAVYCCCC